MSPIKQAIEQVEHWQRRRDELARQVRETEARLAAERDGLTGALVDGRSSDGAADQIARLEITLRGQQAALEQTGDRVAAAEATRRELEREQAARKAHRLAGEVRQAEIERGRALAALLEIERRKEALRREYYALVQALDLPDEVRQYGDGEVTLGEIRSIAHLLQLRLGDDYALTGLPPYQQINLRE